ncbi:MAG: LysR family transcriptional regulator [Methanobacteriaceae archaeon]
MDFKAEISIIINGKKYNNSLFKSLEAISSTYSQRKAAKNLEISHSVLNRRIINAENDLGFKLVETRGTGSELTEEGIKLLNKYYKYINMTSENDELIICGGHIICGLLETLISNLPPETKSPKIYSSNDENAYELARKGIVDILALDDPVIAFENDLDLVPIAYDYLVLVESETGNNTATIKSIEDLKDSSFIGVKGSAQRLAWNTLKSQNIPFNIIKEVNSQYEAFKIVKNYDKNYDNIDKSITNGNNKVYTFLNASFFSGGDILKNETQHTINLVPYNENNNDLNSFINFILNNRVKIAKEGFIPIG